MNRTRPTRRARELPHEDDVNAEDFPNQVDVEPAKGGDPVAAPAIRYDEMERIRRGPKTVTVACKLPSGMILRLFRPEMRLEPVVGGGSREVKVYHPLPDTVIINGNAVPQNGQAPAFTILNAHRRGDGFGLTYNVSADFWYQWLEANKDAQYVKEGLIWAYADQDSVNDKAKDLDAVKSGLEPLNPDGDPRAPKQITKGDRKVA